MADFLGFSARARARVLPGGNLTASPGVAGRESDRLAGAPSRLLVRLGRLAVTPQLRPKGRALCHQRGPERLSIGARFGRFCRLGTAAPPRVGP